MINGEKDTRLLTDSYQDTFYYTYAYQKGVFERDSCFETPGSGLYTPIRQFLSNEILLPLTGGVIEPRFAESGCSPAGYPTRTANNITRLPIFITKTAYWSSGFPGICLTL